MLASVLAYVRMRLLMCACVHVRYDYQPADLGCMLEILACIKGVACLLPQANTWMSGYLYQAVYLQMQGFVQLALTHTDPRNKVKGLTILPRVT